MTKEQSADNTLLANFRVLDLADEKGFLCGKILGDMGADVIKIEKPGGDTSRNIGPFYHDIPDPEKSLYWFAFNNNKRGITLNIESIDGRNIFKKLVANSEVVIESFPPGYMDKLGLSYSELSKINPRVIVASITPFGQTGPYRNHKGSDIIASAMGGQMALCGDSDQAPLRIGFPQAYLHAGARAALGILIAHHHREKNGQGQHVDVSLQESMVPTVLGMPIAFWLWQKLVLQRAGASRPGLGANIPQTICWQCKDGYVMFALFGGATGARFNPALVKWMDEEGMAPDFLKDVDWHTFDISKVTLEEYKRVEEPVGRFFMTHTKAELYQRARRDQYMLFPINSSKDVAEDPQLSFREFWTEAPHPELGVALNYPGAFAKFSETPCGAQRRAPLIGEHNLDVYEGEFGFTREELILLKQGGVI